MPKRKKSITTKSSRSSKTRTGPTSRPISGKGPRKHSRQSEFSLKMREKISKIWVELKKKLI